MKIELTNNTRYAEEGQINPLLWKIMLRDGDVYTDQSGWIKCKDFFNDMVAYFQTGKVMSIYGFCNKYKTNDEGVYFLLKNIKDVAQFIKNMGVVNAQLHTDLETWVDCERVKHEKDQVMILVPPKCWENTYYISLISMCVRLCNYGYEYNTWDDLWKTTAPVRTIEHSFSGAAIENAMKMGFKLKPAFSKYWFYSSKDINSEKSPDASIHYIHNCGCSTWSMAMKG